MHIYIERLPKPVVFSGNARGTPSSLTYQKNLGFTEVGDPKKFWSFEEDVATINDILGKIFHFLKVDINNWERKHQNIQLNMQNLKIYEIQTLYKLNFSVEIFENFLYCWYKLKL